MHVRTMASGHGCTRMCMSIAQVAAVIGLPTPFPQKQRSRTCTLLPAVLPAAYLVERDISYNLGPYLYSVAVYSVEQCATICSLNPACKAWLILMPPDIAPGNYGCNLKSCSNVTRKFRESYFVSGTQVWCNGESCRKPTCTFCFVASWFPMKHVCLRLQVATSRA